MMRAATAPTIGAHIRDGRLDPMPSSASTSPRSALSFSACGCGPRWDRMDGSYFCPEGCSWVLACWRGGRTGLDSSTQMPQRDGTDRRFLSCSAIALALRRFPVRSATTAVAMGARAPSLVRARVAEMTGVRHPIARLCSAGLAATPRITSAACRSPRSPQGDPSASHHVFDRVMQVRVVEREAAAVRVRCLLKMSPRTPPRAFPTGSPSTR